MLATLAFATFATAVFGTTAALPQNVNAGVKYSHVAVYAGTSTDTELTAIADAVIANAIANHSMPQNVESTYHLKHSNTVPATIQWFVFGADAAEGTTVNTALAAALGDMVEANSMFYAAPTVTEKTVHSTIKAVAPAASSTTDQDTWQTDVNTALATAPSGFEGTYSVNRRMIADQTPRTSWYTIYTADNAGAMQLHMVATIEANYTISGNVVVGTATVYGTVAEAPAPAPVPAATATVVPVPAPVPVAETNGTVVAALSVNRDFKVKYAHLATYAGSHSSSELFFLTSATVAAAIAKHGMPNGAMATTQHISGQPIEPNQIMWYVVGPTADAATVNKALVATLAAETISSGGESFAPPTVVRTNVHSHIVVTLPSTATATEAEAWHSALLIAARAYATTANLTFGQDFTVGVDETVPGTVYISIIDGDHDEAALQSALRTLADAAYGGQTGTTTITSASNPGSSSDGSGSAVIIIIILLLLCSSSAAAGAAAYYFMKVRPQSKTAPEAENDVVPA